MNGGESKLVTVTQFGFGKQIIVREPEVEIPSSDTHKNVILKLPSLRMLNL